MRLTHLTIRRPVRSAGAIVALALMMFATSVSLPVNGGVATVAGEVGLGIEEASAHTSGGNATGGGQWHWWRSDGCTKVPNWIPGVYNFTHACQHHDGCYANHWASRSTCDRWLLNDMLAGWCWASWNCRNFAYTYYAGVRACGQYSYNNRSISTPLSRLCW